MRSNDPAFLYVEDDVLSQQVIETLLQRVLGYSKISFFSDSTDFMRRVQALPEVPTVIFLDIQMSPYDGYSVLEMLRACPAYQNTRIIAMTANVMATDIEKLKATGFDGLIGKPIDRQLFPELVQQILDGETVWFVN